MIFHYLLLFMRYRVNVGTRVLTLHIVLPSILVHTPAREIFHCITLRLFCQWSRKLQSRK